MAGRATPRPGAIRKPSPSGFVADAGDPRRTRSRSTAEDARIGGLRPAELNRTTPRTPVPRPTPARRPSTGNPRLVVVPEPDAGPERTKSPRRQTTLPKLDVDSTWASLLLSNLPHRPPHRPGRVQHTFLLSNHLVTVLDVSPPKLPNDSESVQTIGQPDWYRLLRIIRHRGTDTVSWKRGPGFPDRSAASQISISARSDRITPHDRPRRRPVLRSAPPKRILRRCRAWAERATCTGRVGKPLDAIFDPRSVAVLGASERPEHLGRIALRNLIGTSFGGTVYPVTPHRKSVFGIRNVSPAQGRFRSRSTWPLIATPAGPRCLTRSPSALRRVSGGAIVASSGLGANDPRGDRNWPAGPWSKPELAESA